MRLNSSITSVILVICLTLGGLAQEQETTIAEPIEMVPTVQNVPLPAEQKTPQEIELKSRLLEAADGSIKLQKDDASSGIKSVVIKAGYEGQGWFTRFEGEAQTSGLAANAKLQLLTEKELFGVARTFARWKHEAGDDALQTGISMGVFGKDKLRLTREFHPLSENRRALTEISYKRELWGDNSIRFLGNTNSLQQELGSEFLHKQSDDFLWGASVKSQKLQNEPGGDQWGRPSVEGTFRWTW